MNSAMMELVKEIESEYYSFDITQLVWVIREIFGDLDEHGDNGRIFFEADPSLAFPPSDVAAVNINISGKEATVRLPVMNLLGSSSPLPIKFSDYITRGLPDADTHMDFLSIMQNRLHAIWIDAQRDRAHSKLDAFPRGPRSSCELKRLLRSTWKDIPVRIEENIERLTTVVNRSPVGQCLSLGKNAVVGSKISDRTTKFRVSIGPLDRRLYKSFLPGGNDYKKLQEIITQYLNEPLICELELSCSKSELSPVRTGGGEGQLGRTAALGRVVDDGSVHTYRGLITLPASP